MLRRGAKPVMWLVIWPGNLACNFGAGEGEKAWRRLPASPHFIVGMTNSAPSLTPEGQREVTVLVLV